MLPHHLVTNFLRDVVDAVRGKPHDYTSGSLIQAVTVLAVPMVLEMLMESVFILVDVYFVAQLGADALAVVSISEQVIGVIYSVAIGLSMAAAAMVARRVGEKRMEAASSVAVQAILLGLVVSLPITAMGVFFPRQILHFMNASPQVIEVGWLNLALMLASNATIILLHVINAIFRGAGRPTVAMRVLWYSNGINIILDPCLIFGYGPFPALGVTGAAVATIIGRGFGVCLLMYYLFRGNDGIRVNWKQFVPRFDILRRLFELSRWGIIQWMMPTFSLIVLLRLTAQFGSNAVAGYSVGVRILLFLALPIWGLANAVATLVGQNLGANKPDRAEKSVWISAAFSAAFMFLVTILFLLFNRPLVLFFTTEPEVVYYAVATMRIVGYCLVSWGVGLIFTQSFNGAGDTKTPTAINFVCFWLFQIPFAYLLALYFEMGAEGVFWAVSVAQGLLTPVGGILFKRGKWKTKVV